jgi:hypothetical protein
MTPPSEGSCKSRYQQCFIAQLDGNLRLLPAFARPSSSVSHFLGNGVPTASAETAMKPPSEGSCILTIFDIFIYQLDGNLRLLPAFARPSSSVSHS